MANPQEGEGTLEERARAYLDANCAHCHRPNGYASSGDHGLDFRYELPLEDSGHVRPDEVLPRVGWDASCRAREPGGLRHPAAVPVENELRMPSIGTSTVDPFGAELLRDWIAQMNACP